MNLQSEPHRRPIVSTVALGVVLLAAVVDASAQATNCVAPPAGLVSWWRGQANAFDQAGTNNGTLTGNTTYGAGRVGQGFVFDGSGDAVSIGNPASLQLQDFSIETWIKRASTTVASSDFNAGWEARRIRDRPGQSAVRQEEQRDHR
jgi:hypothetical protein